MLILRTGDNPKRSADALQDKYWNLKSTISNYSMYQEKTTVMQMPSPGDQLRPRNHWQPKCHCTPWQAIHTSTCLPKPWTRRRGIETMGRPPQTKRDKQNVVERRSVGNNRWCTFKTNHCTNAPWSASLRPPRNFQNAGTHSKKVLVAPHSIRR